MKNSTADPSFLADKYIFGAHQFLWKQIWTDEDLKILDEARNLGLSLFEVSLGEDVHFDYRRLNSHARDLKMELSIGPGNVWDMDCDISHDDPAMRDKGIAWHKKIIERAAECGAKAYCGAIYSHPGRVCRREPLKEEMYYAAENLHLLAEFADDFHVRLVIEPMSRFRNHLINNALQASKLAVMADHPNLSINLDTFHMITEERDYGQAIRIASPKLWGIHACENDRGVPGGGLVPWTDIFHALQEINAPVRVMMETYRTGPDGFGFDRGIFQNLCPDPVVFVERGLRFLQSQVR